MPAQPTHPSPQPGTPPSRGPARQVHTILRDHADDAVSVLALAIVVLVIVLDLVGITPVSGEVLVKIALFVGSGLAINLTVRHARGKDASAVLDDVRTEVKGQGELMRTEVEGLGELLRTHLGAVEVSQIPSADISSWLEEQLRTARSWSFRGGSGRWQRRRALPVLADTTELDVDYVMQILNPMDQTLCQRYAEYRSRQRKGDDRRENEEAATTVRDDLLACVYAAGWYGARTRIRAQVYLMPLYSPMRIDAGTESLIVSIADKHAPALHAPASGWYYKALLDELAQAKTEVARVRLPEGGESMYPWDWRTVRGTHVRAMLEAVTIVKPDRTDALFGHPWWQDVDHDRIAKLAFLGRE